MATKIQKTKEAERQETLDAQVSRTEQFYNENKKTIWTAVAAVVIVGLAVLGYSKYIYAPKAAEAQGQMFQAEISFQQGNYELALNGDGNVYGFAQVIDEYGSKAGKAVYLYAGICALKLEQYEDAVSYLKKYNGSEPILAARALACEGDALVALEDYAGAASVFGKAAAKADNMFAAGYLLKQGLAYEKLGENGKALDCYKAIKEKYPQSIEGYDIDRYISAIK